jgi:ATP-dependent DNA ligase
MAFPSFAETQAAINLLCLDLLHLEGRDTAALPLERKALLEPIVADIPGLQFNGHEMGDGELKALRSGTLRGSMGGLGSERSGGRPTTHWRDSQRSRPLVAK